MVFKKFERNHSSSRLFFFSSNLSIYAVILYGLLSPGRVIISKKERLKVTSPQGPRPPGVIWHSTEKWLQIKKNSQILLKTSNQYLFIFFYFVIRSSVWHRSSFWQIIFFISLLEARLECQAELLTVLNFFFEKWARPRIGRAHFSKKN